MYQTEKEIRMQQACRGSAEPTPFTKIMQIAEDDRDKLVLERIEHFSTRRSLTLYRWLALAGWALAVTALAMRPAEAADMTLPKGMLACDSRDAWADQSQNLGAGLTILSPGCVFTNRDLRVEVIDFKVFSGTEVYVRDVDLTIFVDGGVLK